MKTKNISRVGKYRKIVFIFLFLLCSFFILGKLDVKAEGKEKNLVNIYFIHSNTCSHCQREEKLLEQIEKEYQNIMIYRYEVHEDSTSEVLEKLSEVYSIKSKGVPITIIGNKVYTGYSEEKSRLKFIKTIEYFSRYGYHDKLGEALGDVKLPKYQEKETNPTLEEFLDTYENITLFGFLHTDDLDVSLIAILLGFLSSMNIVSFVMILIVGIILKKVNTVKDKIILLSIYFVSFIVIFMTYVFSKKEFVLGIVGILFLLTVGGIFKYGWNKRNKKKKEVSWNQNEDKLLLLCSLFILLAVGANYIGSFIFNKYIVIFRNILVLHHVSRIELITYYLNYFFIIVMINILFLFLVVIFLNKIGIHQIKYPHN